MGTDGTSNTVQSDENLLAILRAIREDDRHGVTEIAEELDMAKSTVHGHLTTLEEHGFLDRTDGQYDVGFRFLDYGIFARNNHPLFKAAKQSVDELAEETNERAWCVIERNGQAVYLYGATGRRAIQTHEHVGEHRTLHDIAAGKAILAFLPDERIEEIVEATDLEAADTTRPSSEGDPVSARQAILSDAPRQFLADDDFDEDFEEMDLDAETERTITTHDDIYNELAEIRERGIAFNFEESMEGVHAAGAPIRRVDGGVYGAISVGGPARRMTKDRLTNDIADMLLGMANEIEVNIRHQ
ncbi:MAG: IclR family transcriptional regulator [Halobacteriaceae archaeon]